MGLDQISCLLQVSNVQEQEAITSCFCFQYDKGFCSPVLETYWCTTLWESYIVFVKSQATHLYWIFAIDSSFLTEM